MQYVSTSVTLLILENPFVPGILAYLVANENITNREWVVFVLATIGLVLLSSKASESKQQGMESVGIALVCVASAIQSLGIISLRKMRA
jgi:drug/metabolite transporter (DMT)-like permease